MTRPHLPYSVARRPTVLVADDDEVTLHLLESQLKDSGYPVRLARDGQDALDALRDAVPRIVLSDWLMPNLNGLELCRKIKGSPSSPFTYFIMLTMQGETSKMVEAYEAGVNDFLAKPCEHAELAARLHAGERMIELETALRRRVRLTTRLNDRLTRVNRRLTHMASTDSLTGLPNRREAMSRLQSEWAAAERYRHGLTIAMIDVDNFKGFNDSFGHQKGDELLRTIAVTLTSMLREVDLAARLGGDEFLTIFPHTCSEGAKASLARIKKEIHDVSGGLGIISVGIATKSQNTTNIESLIHTADQALYKEKSASRAT